MKVITLDRIKDFIEDKHGEQTISRFSFKGFNKKPGIVVIHNAGNNKLKTFINENNELEFSNKHGDIHCILLETDLEDFDATHPFIKLREALTGTLVIDNKIPTEDEISKYLYKL